MIIEVTQEDIDAGCKCHPNNCPVANAIQRITKAVFVSVNPSQACISLFGGNFRYFDLPGEVTEFIHNFDLDKIVVPFSFELGV